MDEKTFSSDQAQALVMAASLRAACWLSAPLAAGYVVAISGLLQSVSPEQTGGWILVLLCSFVASFYLFRASLDADLFEWIGQAKLDASRLDGAVASVFAKKMIPARPMSERIRGARRLQYRLLMWVGLQWLVMLLGFFKGLL